MARPLTTKNLTGRSLFSCAVERLPDHRSPYFIKRYTVYWVRELARRYNRLGMEGLGDRRHHHPGAETLLDEVQTAQLLQAIEGPASDGGLWNGRKVADWMSELLERPISPQRGWEYFKTMEYRWKIPRPENKQADRLEQEA